MTHGKNNHLIAACMDEKGKAVNQQGKAREKKKKQQTSCWMCGTTLAVKCKDNDDSIWLMS